MPIALDLPYGLDDLEKVFEVSEFLENKDELVKDFKPEVAKFLVRKGFFTGAFKKTYDLAFEELIIKLIKSQLVRHFNYTPEEILLLTDKSFLKMITNDFYFNQDVYKDVKHEHAH